MKTLRRFLGVLMAAFVVYFVFIPIVWSLCVMESEATSGSGGKMIVHYVLAWPDRHLFAYKVSWQVESEEIDLGNGRIFLIPERTFEGWCYVDECEFK